MIIGNGDIASVLKKVDNPDLLFFASGVSNSQETRQEEYDREWDLLRDQKEYRHIVYFSSLCIFYSNSRYADHKKFMEQEVKDRFDSYTIIRLGNITWGKNPHTLINAMRNKIKRGEELEIRDEYRYLVNEEEFLHWIKLIPPWDCEMNITGKRLKVEEIVNIYGYASGYSK